MQFCGNSEKSNKFFKFFNLNKLCSETVLGHQLRGYFETRWVERQELILEFTKDLSKISEALRAVTKWIDGSKATKANTLL